MHADAYIIFIFIQFVNSYVTFSKISKEIYNMLHLENTKITVQAKSFTILRVVTAHPTRTFQSTVS